MKELIGRPGSLTGFMLRIGQWLFAATSIGVMVSASGFSNYTAFCYLIASMGLQVLWSFGLSCLDLYAMRIKRDLQSPILVSLFVVGDWSFRALNSGHTLPYRNIYFCYALLFAYSLVTATLSLAAACSSAGIVILYGRDLHYCKGPLHIPCGRYELSIALAFATWFLIAISSHVMFWILASV